MSVSLRAGKPLGLLLLLVLLPSAALQGQARPIRGGVGGPASGAGVAPGAGWGAPGLGAGGVGGPASGAGVRPGAGWGAPGVGAGGIGGPASGAGVRPGLGWGAPGVGLTRAPAAAYGAAAYHPAWTAGGYWAARPWPGGWYGASTLAWWGTTSLATATAVTAAVNAAAAAQSPWFVIPQTTLQLNYASVVAFGSSGVRFSYQAAGISQAAFGDCMSGQLNGQSVNGSSAALLNAACTVAFGPGG